MLHRLSSNLGFHLSSTSLRYAGVLAQRTFVQRDSRSCLPRRLRQTSEDERWSDSNLLSDLEAILFVASQPLPSRKLAQLTHLADGTAARTMVKKLNATYEGNGRAFRVEEVAGGYQLRTQKIFAPWIRRMVSVPPEIRMSGPAMETLAVVAYRQPVMRTEIEKVRGVQCGEILRQLMDRGMVRISGRADDLGRPFLYGTTRNFLEVFGLRSLDELPRASMLRATAMCQATVATNGQSDPSAYQSVIEEDGVVSVCDVTDQAEQQSLDSESEQKLPITAMEDDDDFDEEYEDTEEDTEEDDDGDDDGDDEFEDDEFEDEDEEDADDDEDDGFNDEEWEEVEDDDADEQDEDWDEEEDDDWDDDEDWDEDDDEEKVE